MPTSSPATSKVRAYIASRPPGARRYLEQIRAAILEAAPGAVEHFSYRIPGFRLDGKTLVWYAAFAHHCSLYPMTASIRRKHAAELSGYETSKGTIRFRLERPLSTALVKRLVKSRIAELRKARR
jgi:uncharacterized protein YdhG (YjbR/CyaY superfamily)